MVKSFWIKNRSWRLSTTHDWTVQDSFKSLLTIYSLVFNIEKEKIIDIENLLGVIKPDLLVLIKKELEIKLTLKYYIHVSLNFEKAVQTPSSNQSAIPQQTIENQNVRVVTRARVLTRTENINKRIDDMFAELSEKIQSFQGRGSGLIITSINEVNLHTAKYCGQLGRGCASVNIPQKIKLMRSIINYTHRRNKCFLYAVCVGLMPQMRQSLYTTLLSCLNYEMLSFPTPLSEISLFEKINDISVHVLGYENNEFYMLRRAKSRRTLHVNLLYLDDSENNEEGHYLTITNFNALFVTNKNRKAVYCDNCLNGFNSEEILLEHISYCLKYPSQAIQMPSVGSNILRFEKYQHCLLSPFCLAFDFESVQIKINCTSSSGKTIKTKKHEPCSFVIILIGPQNEIVRKISYVGQDAGSKFMEELLQLDQYITKALEVNYPVHTSKNTREEKKIASYCYLCKKVFTLDSDKTIHHLHYKKLENFAGIACASCNLLMRQNHIIVPCFAHNSNFDISMFISHLSLAHTKNIQLIARNNEKFISLQIGKHLRILDSLNFLPSSLDNLVHNLKLSGEENFIITRTVFAENFNLMIRKGCFPYSYITHTNLQETKLPSIDDFFDDLNNRACSTENYLHAQQVWTNFKCNTLQDFLLIYNLSDVTLLLDCILQFRNMVHSKFHVDIFYYYGIPSLTFSSWLKYCRIELDMLTDYNIYLYFEDVCGGISLIPNRYFEAKNRFTHPDSYDIDNEKFLLFVDATALYTYCLMFRQPCGQHVWLTKQEIDACNFLETPDDFHIGYRIECDLHVPLDLHDYFNDLPLAVSQFTCTEKMLSHYTLNMRQQQNQTSFAKMLIPNLFDKSKFICDYRLLKRFVKYGLIIKKVYRILSYRQDYVVREYVTMLTEMRKQAKTTYERDLFKLLSNSLYGTFLQNQRGYVKRDIALTTKQVKKLVASPYFESFQNVSDSVSIICSKYKKIKLNRPYFIGSTILDLSKSVMYDYHYGLFKKNFSKCKLLLMDTDSLLYGISIAKNELNPYEFVKNNSHLFDLSNLDPNSILGKSIYNECNKSKPGTLKLELGHYVPTEFVGLRAKSYALKYISLETKEEFTKKVLKGIKRDVVKQEITFDDYKTTLFDSVQFVHSATLIRQIKHNVFNVKLTKSSLSANDQKRWILEDHSTLAIGHFNANHDECCREQQ